MNMYTRTQTMARMVTIKVDCLQFVKLWDTFRKGIMESNITIFPCPGFNTVWPQGGGGGFMHHLWIQRIASLFLLKAFISPRSFSLKIIKQRIPIIHFPNKSSPSSCYQAILAIWAIKTPTTSPHTTTRLHHATQVSWLCNFTRSALYLVRALAASSSAKARWVRISWRSRVICTGDPGKPATGLGKREQKW